jgi:LysM repeat protein
MIKLLIPLFVLNIGLANATVRKDSIGVERHAGKFFILHRVEPKETLFSLSRRYQVTVDEIVASNPDAKEGLKIASVVRIPAVEKQVNLPTARKHVVQPSETLFSISQKYNVEVARIMSANQLKDQNLRIGQELLIPVTTSNQSNSTGQSTNAQTDQSKIYHTVAAGETLFSLSRTYQVEVEQIKRWNNLADNNLKLGQSIVVGEKNRTTAAINTTSIPEQSSSTQATTQRTVTPTASSTHLSPCAKQATGEEIRRHRIEDNEYVKNKTNTSSETRIDKVTESGFAELIEGSDDTKKYLALHKTAPVGTIMQVRNEMNNMSVFVRIIGKLPDTGENERIRIKLSKIAYDHLGAIDARFPVQISYVPR